MHIQQQGDISSRDLKQEDQLYEMRRKDSTQDTENIHLQIKQEDYLFVKISIFVLNCVGFFFNQVRSTSFLK